jgi:hypothetical protein
MKKNDESTSDNTETTMKKNDQKSTSRKKKNANQRNSVGSTESRTETGKIRNRSNAQLPDQARVVDRLEEKTDAGKFIDHPAASVTSRGVPLKVRQQDGMTYIDGDQSSLIQTFGTSDPDLGLRLFLQVCATLPPELRGDCNYVLSVFRAIGPKDGVEGILAAQMAAVSTAAMHFSALATAAGQPAEFVEANVNLASKLSRTFTAQMEALNRHRGTISHPLVVGNVNVNDGGRAIVGSVQHSGPEEDQGQ